MPSTVSPQRTERDETLPAHGFTASVLAAIRLVRPHQWCKNALLFVPAFLAHAFSVSIVSATTLAFVSFCLCSSAVYVLNDLLDIDSDRLHPIKRNRPLASGKLDKSVAILMGTILAVVGLTIAFLALPYEAVAVISGYLILTTLYSIWLKKKAVVDVFVLAGLYTLRIIAGGVAANVEVSQWLLAFSIFFFTSLAFAKRHSELSRLNDEGNDRTRGRGYLVRDLDIIGSLGPTSGYLAVLVLALYIQSDAMRQNYTSAWPLWLLCPLLMYWVTRLWLICGRGELSEDPVSFAITDRVSHLVGFVSMCLVISASSTFG